MRPKRETIANGLRASIAEGHYPEGSKLPSESEIAQQYGASRETVRAALKTLVNVGLISSAVGKGAYVRNRQLIQRHATPRLSKNARMANQGMHLAEAANRDESSSIETSIYIEFADQQVATDLGGIKIGTEVLVRDRIMSIDDQPTQLAVSRYPRALTKGTPIEQEDTGPGGVLSRFEEAGNTISGHTERVRVHRVDQDEADALQVPLGSAGLRIIRTTINDQGKVLEVNTMTLVDRYELIYALPAE